MIRLADLSPRRRLALGLVTVLGLALICAPWRGRLDVSTDRSAQLLPRHRLLSRRVIFGPPRVGERLAGEASRVVEPILGGGRRLARDPQHVKTAPNDPDDLLDGEEDLLWDEIVVESLPATTHNPPDAGRDDAASPPTQPAAAEFNDSNSSLNPPALPAPPLGAPLLEVPVEPATEPAAPADSRLPDGAAASEAGDRDGDAASVGPTETSRPPDSPPGGAVSDKPPAASEAAGLQRFDALIEEVDQLLDSRPAAAAKDGAQQAPVPADEPASTPDTTSADDYLIDPADDLLYPPRDAGNDPPPKSSPSWEYQLTPRDGADDGGRQLDQRSQELVPVPAEGLPPPSFQRPPTMPAPHGKSSAPPRGEGEEDPHRELFAKKQYPSAKDCAECHKKIYEEWSGSSHAYAAISPMFHRFEQKINDLSQGTIGYFCYRCHAPVATAMCATRATPLWELSQVEREGVTCIVCHRVNERYGKVNGERRIVKGDIYAPVYGGIGGDGIAEVIAKKDHFKVKTSPAEKGPGQPMHTAGLFFEQISQSEFCVSCHQVAVHPGIKLEVVWEQYRASPARKKGIRCQDCHMGRVPGVASGFEIGAAAEVNGKTVCRNRKHSNHVFYGPGYSIAHPGIFPHHLKADRWSMDEWLLFDWRAGWGTEAFEERVDRGEINVHFPPVWAEVDDRYDAREIIEENLKKLSYKRELRRQVLENGSRVDGPFFPQHPTCGQDLTFNYVVTNTNEGHNLPSGSLGAQPQLWANVVLIGPQGRRLWESGYTDTYGDVADIHSHDVRNKRLPFDWQLFNLQTMFLITGAKGTDREFFLPINVDIDQLPFIRPANIPTTVTNHPPFIRMEGRSLSPLGSRRVKYRVPGHLIQRPGHYRLAFRMRSRAEPIYFMRFCGATTEMQRSMNEWMVDIHPSSVQFYVQPTAP